MSGVKGEAGTLGPSPKGKRIRRSVPATDGYGFDLKNVLIEFDGSDSHYARSSRPYYRARSVWTTYERNGLEIELHAGWWCGEKRGEPCCVADARQGGVLVARELFSYLEGVREALAHNAFPQVFSPPLGVEDEPPA